MRRAEKTYFVGGKPPRRAGKRIERAKQADAQLHQGNRDEQSGEGKMVRMERSYPPNVSHLRRWR